MKIGIKNNEVINTLAVFAGVLMFICVLLVICLGMFILSILFLCISSVFFIDVIISNIQNLLNYIVIDDESITLFRHKKPVKHINLINIHSLVLGQYLLGSFKISKKSQFSNDNIFIVINDGTFMNKKWTRKCFKKEILSENEGWIAIEFSAKRYAQIKQLLPNCEVETYTLTKKKK